MRNKPPLFLQKKVAVYCVFCKQNTQYNTQAGFCVKKRAQAPQKQQKRVKLLLMRARYAIINTKKMVFKSVYLPFQKDAVLLQIGCVILKVVILAGGLGTRISEESHLKPKPMIEIGDKPIMWHIMKLYSHYGFNDFVICAGYKQHVIKEFFADYFLHSSDVTFDLQTNSMQVHDNFAEPWKVTVVDTGLNTMTGGRVKRVQKHIGNEPFLLTYGDGVADVNIAQLLAYHKEHGHLCTMTATNVGQRFGVLDIEQNGQISGFREKSDSDGSMINVGFMVCEPKVFDYIEGDATVLEKEPIEGLANDGELVAYKHCGFWQCMDTQREKQKLEELWATEHAPWKVW